MHLTFRRRGRRPTDGDGEALEAEKAGAHPCTTACAAGAAAPRTWVLSCFPAALQTLRVDAPAGGTQPVQRSATWEGLGAWLQPQRRGY